MRTKQQSIYKEGTYLGVIGEEEQEGDWEAWN